MDTATELHKKVAKVKTFRHVLTHGKDDVWSIDLVDMGELVDNGYRYIFMCIDCFTRYGWAVPLKDKSSGATWKAFAGIMSASKRRPEKIWADQGSEFFNDLWKKNLGDITLYYTGNEKKAVMVERLNRTIKTWTWKLFSEHGNKKWVDALPALMERYNSKVHSSLGVSPHASSLYWKELTPTQKTDLVETQYSDAVGHEAHPKYKLLDWVRIARTKKTFEKGYTAKWSTEIYQIVGIDLNAPVLYHLRDTDGEDIKSGFYQNEIQKTAMTPEQYRKSLTRVHNKAKDDVIVKVLGWRESGKAKFNRFVMKVRYASGKVEEVRLGEYIGVEVNGVFKAGARNATNILAPFGDYVQTDKVLKKEVWDKI